MTKRTRITTVSTIEQDAARVYEILVAGGLALVPTNVGYGLVAIRENAVGRIYELKGRPLSKPCVTVANSAIYDEVVLAVEPQIRAWLAKITARTPLAVISQLNLKSRLLGAMSPWMRSQVTHNGTIATFFSAGPLVQRLAKLAFADGTIVVGSSANLSGTGNNYTIDEVPRSIQQAVDLVLDRGVAQYANDQRLATTILDLTTGTFQRKGINHALIASAWNAIEPATQSLTA